MLGCSVCMTTLVTADSYALANTHVSANKHTTILPHTLPLSLSLIPHTLSHPASRLFIPTYSPVHRHTYTD